MPDISGFGAQAQIRASVTFPAGVNITQFADDADPIDAPSIQIADKAMGLNGDLVTWAKASPIIVTLNVIANSDDDKNLSVLFEANRVGRGKNSSQDVITMAVTFPTGRKVTYSAGRITDGQPGDSVASAGRLKTKAYAFAFENKVEADSGIN